MVFKVLHFFHGIWDDGIRARLPSRGANLSVFIRVLESLNQAKSFVHASTHGEVVHGDLAEDAFVVDDEETSEGNAIIFKVDTIVLRDLLGEIRQKWDVKFSKSPLSPRRVHPGQMSEMRVYRGTHHLSPNLTELLDPIVEGENLCWTHEGEVERIEEENEVLSFEVVQF